MMEALPFRDPGMKLQFAYRRWDDRDVGQGERRSYYLYAESAYVLKDAFHVESGEIEDNDMERWAAKDTTVGPVLGMHAVPPGARHGIYAELMAARDKLERTANIDANFVIVAGLAGIFDPYGQLHTVLKLGAPTHAHGTEQAGDRTDSHGSKIACST